MNRKIFACYSVPLMKYLTSQNLKYEIIGLNPESKKTFWIFIMCDELKEKLDFWKLKTNLK